MKQTQTNEILQSLQEYFNIAPLKNEMLKTAITKEFIRYDYDEALSAFQRMVAVEKSTLYSISDAVKSFHGFYSKLRDDKNLEQQRIEQLTLQSINPNVDTKPDIIRLNQGITPGWAKCSIEGKAFTLFCRMRFYGYIKVQNTYSGTSQFYKNGQSFSRYKDFIIERIRDRQSVSLKKLGVELQKEIKKYEIKV